MKSDSKVLDADRARRAAMVGADIGVLEQLLADDLVLVHASARVDTKETLLSAIKSGAVNYLSIDTSDESCRYLGDNVAVLSGVSAVSAEVDGSVLALTNRFVIAWHRTEKGWQAVHWQSTGLRQKPR
ncbi:nuclear transport factor 2 family protein [Nocardia vinacea]|uniref:nuclear transport factor 2 family protein n=1 Tax=Nocardia vinacea TaxID=96468 RepID=UPI002E11DA17|nr:nuclear transport factor 2 family protein [Nocardia vinacea]